MAVVVKYADNILKGFAASFSIVTSCFLSYLVFDFHPNLLFVMGAVMVNLSMYMYSYAPPVEKEKRLPAQVMNMRRYHTIILSSTTIHCVMMFMRRLAYNSLS